MSWAFNKYTVTLLSTAFIIFSYFHGVSLTLEFVQILIALI